MNIGKKNDTKKVPQKYTIRWLCFARVTKDVLSLHWRGFSHSPLEENSQRNSQFRYWEFIPKLFEEISILLNADLEDVNIVELILHTLWSKYRENPEYEWLDEKIRSEGGGVSLNASGPRTFIEIGGIAYLAETLRKSIYNNLLELGYPKLQQPEALDKVILNTLIREFGPLSYQLTLKNLSHEKPLLRAKVYFGLKRSPSADLFAHLNFFADAGDDIKQLYFLLDNLSKCDDDATATFTQNSLF